jgi:hypothetical protein
MEALLFVADVSLSSSTRSCVRTVEYGIARELAIPPRRAEPAEDVHICRRAGRGGLLMLFF